VIKAGGAVKCSEIVFTLSAPPGVLDIRLTGVYNDPSICKKGGGYGVKRNSLQQSCTPRAAVCGMSSFFAFNSAARFTDSLRFFFYYDVSRPRL
jgi:hypothetical protein